MRALRDGDDRQTGIERWCQIIGIGVVGEHVDGVVARVLINRGAVVDCIGSIVDVVDGDVHRGRVGVTRVAGAVIADGVGEAVTAEVVGVRCVAHSCRRKGDAAVCTLRDGDDRQTGIERRRQIVGISVVGEHVDGVVGRVFIHRGAVVDGIRSVVDGRDVYRHGVRRLVQVYAAIRCAAVVLNLESERRIRSAILVGVREEHQIAGGDVSDENETDLASRPHRSTSACRRWQLS